MLRAIVHALRRRLCALHGHDQIAQFEPGHMYLRCVSCGHETHGWRFAIPTLARVGPVPPAPPLKPHTLN